MPDLYRTLFPALPHTREGLSRRARIRRPCPRWAVPFSSDTKKFLQKEKPRKTRFFVVFVMLKRLFVQNGSYSRVLLILPRRPFPLPRSRQAPRRARHPQR